MESMTDILKNEEPAKTEEALPETPEAKAEETVEKPTSKRKDHLAKEYEAQGRDPDTGQFLPKEEPKPEVKTEKVEQPKVEMSEKERALLKAAEEERRKRQALEAELAQYRQPKKEEGEKKTFWDDPEGHFKTHEEKMAAKERAILLNVTERLARSKYTDFDDAISVFAEILKTPAGPGIHAQFLAAPDPAEFAYRLGKHTKEVREAGSVEELRAKIEKETRAKLEAEFKAKQQELDKQRAALTPSLSDVKGATKQHQPVFTGPTPLKDIFGH